MINMYPALIRFKGWCSTTNSTVLPTFILGSNDISLETRDKIFKVAKELNYDYKTLSHSNILVLTNSMFLELEEQFYTKVYKKLIQESTNKNISLTMNVITKDMEKKLKMPSIIENDIDGLIILGELSKEYLEIICIVTKSLHI